MGRWDRPRPLAGIRVLDVSRVVAGPFAGRILADLGADVVKLEPPSGDDTRMYGLVRGGLSGQFIQENVGKRNICVDLKAPGGVELAIRLAASSDIMIENFRPGVLDRLGLSWSVLSARNRGLILLSVTGFGQTGPSAGRRAYAPVIHAETGLIAREAQVDRRMPSDPMPSVADTTSSLHGVIAVLAALHLRHDTGVGQHVDIAMTDAMLATDDYSHHALDAHPIVRVGGDIWEAPSGPPILTAGLFSKTWSKLQAAYGLDDPQGRSGSGQGRTRRQMDVVQRWILSRPTRGGLVDQLEAAGIAWADVRDPMRVFEAPWAEARALYAEIDDRVGGTRRVVQTPYKFSRAASGVSKGISRRGEDNAIVLRDWLSLEDSEVELLEAKSVLLAEERDRPAAPFPGPVQESGQM